MDSQQRHSRIRQNPVDGSNNAFGEFYFGKNPLVKGQDFGPTQSALIGNLCIGATSSALPEVLQQGDINR